MLIYNPVISRLLAVSKLLVPLSNEKRDELIAVVSKTETYKELPDWIREYLTSVQVALKEDLARANKKQEENRNKENG